MNTQNPFSFLKETKATKAHGRKFATIALTCILIMGMLATVVAVTSAMSVPEDSSAITLQKAHAELIQTELQLKDALEASEKAQNALDEAHKKTEELRAKRTAETTQIDHIIHPEVPVVK